MKIYGTADVVNREGEYMDTTGPSNPQYIRITPTKKWSWGIDEPVFVEDKYNVLATLSCLYSMVVGEDAIILWILMMLSEKGK